MCSNPVRGLLILLVSGLFVVGSIGEAAGQTRLTPEQELQQHGYDSSPAVLRKLAQDTSADMESRLLAIRVLGWSFKTDHSDFLLSLVDDENPEIRITAAGSLAGRKDRKGSLVPLLDSRYPKVREIAAIALARLRDERATDVLIGILKSGYETDRLLTLLTALGELDSISATDALIEVGADSSIRLEARLYALDTVVRKNEQGRIDYSGETEALTPILEDSNVNIAASAAVLLAHEGNLKSVPYLVATVLDKSVLISRRLQAATLLETITESDFGFSSVENSLPMLLEAIAAERENRPASFPELDEPGANLQAWWNEHQDEYNNAQ